MSAAVALHGLSKRYGAAIALHPLELSIGRGVTGLLGPNGAGKTTLIRLVATVTFSTAGTIRVLGHEATGALVERTQVRRRIGYLPQELEFPRGKTAFSFLDEPTTGLDPAQRAALRSLLSKRGSHGTVLLATHQTEDVAALCERVIVLSAGRVHFDGPVSEFVATAAGSVWLHERPIPGARVSWRTGTGRIRSIGGTPPTTAEPAEPSVEDAYLLRLGHEALEAEEVQAA
jgi:ABC-type multidrug transport system ATPase subunit